MTTMPPEASKMKSRSSQGIQKDVQGHSSNHRRFIHACVIHRNIELKGPAAGGEALQIKFDQLNTYIYIYYLVRWKSHANELSELRTSR